MDEDFLGKQDIDCFSSMDEHFGGEQDIDFCDSISSVSEGDLQEIDCCNEPEEGGLFLKKWR